jgi:hypothetical protein
MSDTTNNNNNQMSLILLEWGVIFSSTSPGHSRQPPLLKAQGFQQPLEGGDAVALPDIKYVRIVAQPKP